MDIPSPPNYSAGLPLRGIRCATAAATPPDKGGCAGPGGGLDDDRSCSHEPGGTIGRPPRKEITGRQITDRRAAVAQW